MKAQTSQRGIFILSGAVLLALGCILTSRIGPLVLDPNRTADVESTGSSILAEPRMFFRTVALPGRVGITTPVLISVDSNGGNLTNARLELTYNPLDMRVAFDSVANGVCASITNRSHDEVTGRFILECTAPSGGTAQQVNSFASFIVTPRRSGALPIHLVGRSGDYAVVSVP